MIYELRIYRCVPGRLPALLNRFDTITLKLWDKHGIRQAGFWTTAIGESNQDLYYLLAWESLAEREQKFQAFAGLGWEADYPDPQDFLDILFHSESSLNHGAYSNLAVDEVLEEARVEQDPVARMSLYRQAEQMIVDDAAWVPLWLSGDQYVLIKPHIKGFKMTPMIVPKLKQVWIEG